MAATSQAALRQDVVQLQAETATLQRQLESTLADFDRIQAEARGVEQDVVEEVSPSQCCHGSRFGYPQKCSSQGMAVTVGHLCNERAALSVLQCCNVCPAQDAQQLLCSMLEVCWGLPCWCEHASKRLMGEQEEAQVF